MIEEIIQNVIKNHPDFEYNEIEEICHDFLQEQSRKIKEETKIKRLKKYIEKEFEINLEQENKYNNKEYSLDTIPKQLFSGKTDIVSSLINIKKINKDIEKTQLFKNAELKINTNDKISLIGKNGAGKTTLLKMILGIEELDDGVIELANDLKIGYLSQDLFWKSRKNSLRQEMLDIFPEINKKINRLEQIKNNPENWQEIEELNKDLAQLDGFKKYKLQTEILKYFGFSEEQLDFNVLQLSGGEQTKVQIAKFLIQEVDILILDEPTNHLDINGIVFLEQFCQNWQKAILSISHDIRFINNISTKIAEISGKKIHNYPGNYELYLKQKQENFDKENKDYIDQQREIQKQTDYINRFRANSAKATSVQSRIKALDKIEILEKPENETKVKSIKIKQEKRLPEIIMKLSNVEVGYDRPIVRLGEYIEVSKNDKIGIIGKNGAGKTTFLKTILGELEALDGNVDINKDLLVGSYSQVLENLDMESSILDELTKQNKDQTKVRAILGGLLITGDKVDQKIKTLSGGERAKVALTKMLLVKPHIIVMDEPTNHLDIHSKQVIKDMLISFEGTTIVVSHDRDLLHSVSNKVWLISDGVLVRYDEPEIGFAEVFG